MPQYMIESSHTPEECRKAIDAVMMAGAHMLTNSSWGCKGGEHTAWIVIEAEDDAQAHLAVPPAIRRRAKVIKVNRYTPDQVRALHGKA